MGDGTSSGVLTPPQPGVIVRERENFPIIPPKFLKLTPEELQKRIDQVNIAIDFIQEKSVIPDYEREEQLEHDVMIYEFAKTAVERARQAGSLTENQNPLP